MSKFCLGCGVKMQSEDEFQLGYTPNLKNDYCKRCFRLKNYGEVKDGEVIDEEKIFKRVNGGSGMAFFLVDFLNISDFTLNLYRRINIPKALVISKRDTLRKEVKESKVRAWLKQVYQVEEPILFISNKSYYPSSNIFKVMDENQVNTAYLMGVTNAGKSTFLNLLLQKNGLKPQILASKKPNTTMDFIPIKIGDYTIIDTPGFSYLHDDYPLINKEIKPISYVVKANTLLVVGDYILSFLGDNQVTYYGIIPIKREYQNNQLNLFSYSLGENQDIVLPGIGFINIKKSGVILASQPNLEVRLDISGVNYE